MPKNVVVAHISWTISSVWYQTYLCISTARDISNVVQYLNCFKHCILFTVFYKIYDIYNVLKYCKLFTTFYNILQYLQCFTILYNV